MRQNAKNVSPMSNEGRNTYVVGHITDAFLELLAAKPVEDISISELCQRAGVGRASFYRNFESREAVLRAYIDRIFREWTDKYAEYDGQPLSKQLGTLFVHFENHHDFYALLNERGLICLLKDVMVELFGPKPEHQAMEAYTRAFAVYSLYGWIEVWFQRGMQESAEEITALFQGQGL